VLELVFRAEDADGGKSCNEENQADEKADKNSAADVVLRVGVHVDVSVVEPFGAPEDGAGELPRQAAAFPGGPKKHAGRQGCKPVFLWGSRKSRGRAVRQGVSRLRARQPKRNKRRKLRTLLLGHRRGFLACSVLIRSSSRRS
jgi:hypothetical protein